MRALAAALCVATGAALWRAPLAALRSVVPAHVGLLLAMVALAPRPRTRTTAIRPALDLILPFLSGIMAAAFHQGLDPAPALLRSWIGAGYEFSTMPVALRVRLVDRQDLPGDREALIVEILHYRVSGSRILDGTPSAPLRARLTLSRAPMDGMPACRVGDLLDLTARLGPPRRFRNPGSFDYAAYLEARGVALVGTIKSPRLVRVVRRPALSWRRLLAEARGAIVTAIARSAAREDPATAPFLSALLVGEREELSPSFERALMRAGVYHIVALSGLNVAVIALLGGLLLRLLPLSSNLRRLGLLLLILLYWGLARESGSIVRAALMATLYIAGGLAGRHVSVLGAAGVVGSLILIWRPAFIEDAGFQLSMAATLGLILHGAPFATRHRPQRSMIDRVMGRLAASLRLSGAAFVATTLLTALHFQRLAPVALLANLVAVPIANLLLVLALAIALCSPFAPILAMYLAGVASPLIALLVAAAKMLSAWPGASFQVLPPPGALVTFAGDALVLGGTLARRGSRPAAFLVVTLGVLWTAGLGRAQRYPEGLEVTALDVGQGDAILVRLPEGQTLLVDAGGLGRGDFDIGEKVVAPALRTMGILHLDLLAITHAHHDHLGGAAAILEDFRPSAVWLGRMPEDNPEVERLLSLASALLIPVITPRRGVEMTIGSTRVEILNPGPGVGASGPARNDDSLVLRILFGRRAALLTGDLELPIESILVRDGWALQADLLKVGHHGSRTSSSGPFLDRIRPVLALISVGAGNPWGHPDRDILVRLARLPASIHRTDRDGAVSCRTDGIGPWRCGPAGATPDLTEAISGPDQKGRWEPE